MDGDDGFDSVDYRSATSRIVLDMTSGGTLGDAAGDSFVSIERLYATNFNDTVTGTGANEFFYGEDGNDIQRGQEGNDTLYGSAGADQLNGGTGFDIANYRAATIAITVNLATGGTGGDAAGDTYFGLEAIYGSDFNDSMTGNSSTNELRGLDGDDILDGAGGNDRLLVGEGNDTIHGGDGVGTIFGQDGDDVMTGGAGNDFFFGGAGADSHDGGGDIDTVSYLGSSAAVIVNMQTGGTGGDAAGDTYTNIERIFGSSFDDSLRGSFSNDILLGNGGDDFLDGGIGGNDTLIGGAGIDSFGYSIQDGASDVINGFFAANEVIFIYDHFGGESGPSDFNSLLSVASDAGANTIFDFGGGNTLTLVGLNIADLSASNFDFSEMPPAGEPLSDPHAFAASPFGPDIFEGFGEYEGIWDLA